MDIIAKVVTAENISYALYATGNGNGAYIVRDQDANLILARTNGPLEVVTLRYQLDIANIP